MLKRTATVHTIGTSEGIVLPASLPHGKKISLAANRLLLVDPLGELSPDFLLEMLIREIEPSLYRHLESKEGVL